MKAITWDWSRLEKVVQSDKGRKPTPEEIQAIIKHCNALRMKDRGFLYIWDEREE